MPYQSPSHRNTNDEQPEVCELCGNIVGRSHLRVAEVEGLRGRSVCDLHSFERVVIYNPSDRDYRGLYPPPQAPEAGRRLDPRGANFNDLGWIDEEIP